MNFIKASKRHIILLYKSIVDAINHDGVEHAGYISFLMMLSLFPFLVIFMAFVGIFGDHTLGTILIEIILDSNWAVFIDSLKPRILEISDTPPQSLITLALVSATWTASSIFEGLRTILNRAYRVTNTPPYILRRLVSIVEFFVAIGVCFLLVGLLIIIPTVWHFVTDVTIFKDSLVFKIVSPEASNVRHFGLLVIVFITLCYMYYSIPNIKNYKLKDTIPGSIFCLLTWLGFGYGFKYYLKDFPQMSFIYGSIAGVIVTLLYFYFMSLIFIIGAELNYNIKKIGKNE